MPTTPAVVNFMAINGGWIEVTQWSEIMELQLSSNEEWMKIINKPCVLDCVIANKGLSSNKTHHGTMGSLYNIDYYTSFGWVPVRRIASSFRPNQDTDNKHANYGIFIGCWN